MQGWSGTHNVYEVPDATALDNCDWSSGTLVASSSVQTVDVAAPDTPTTKYYVCQEPGHCDADQKIAITWAGDATPAPVRVNPVEKPFSNKRTGKESEGSFRENPGALTRTCA